MGAVTGVAFDQHVVCFAGGASPGQRDLAVMGIYGAYRLVVHVNGAFSTDVWP